YRKKIEQELLPLFKDMGLGTTIWSPLASGLLTGKYNDGIPEDSRLSMKKYDWLREKLIESERGQEKIQKVQDISAIANKLHISMAQFALAWCLQNENVSTVITGASKAEQVEQNMKAIEVVDKLKPEIMEQVEDILDNQPKGIPNFRN